MPRKPVSFWVKWGIISTICGLLGTLMMMLLSSVLSHKMPDIWGKAFPPTGLLMPDKIISLPSLCFRSREESQKFPLHPQSRFIPLIGRDAELQSLMRFLDTSQDVSIRVLIGPSENEKERLAIEFCVEAQKKGWQCGYFIPSQLNDFNTPRISELRWLHPTLLVVEDAMLSVNLLKKMIDAALNNNANQKLRLLLLASEADAESLNGYGSGWWAELFSSRNYQTNSIPSSRLLNPPKPTILGSVHVDDRVKILQETLKQNGSTVNIPDDPEFRTRLLETDWAGSPLFLMLAAFKMEKVGFHDVLSLNDLELVEELVNQTRAKLNDIASAHNLDSKFLQHLAACLSLAQGADVKEFAVFCEEEALRSKVNIKEAPLQYAEALRHLFPDSQAGFTSSRIGSPYPEILGEGIFMRELLEDGKDLEAAAWRCYQKFGLSVPQSLIKGVQNYSNDLRVSGLLKALSFIRDRVGENTERLTEIAELLPKYSLGLNNFSIDLWQDIVSYQKKKLNMNGNFFPEQYLAISLNNLFIYQQHAGLNEEALSTQKEAVTLCRNLVKVDRDVSLPYLAASLNNLSEALQIVGLRKEALDAATEACDLYVWLYETNSDDFRPELAMSLNNYAVHLRDLGQTERALNIAEGVVSLYRELTESDRDAFLPALAASLNNLANFQRNCGLRKEALETIKAAVEIRQELAASNPDTFLPDLAKSLNNLASALHFLGDRKEALTTAAKAAVLYNDLFESNPDSFRSDFVGTLNNFANCMSDFGYTEEALGTIENALGMLHKPMQTNSDAFLPLYSMLLDSYSKHLHTLGRNEEALSAAEGAIAIRREIAEIYPDAFLPSLATSLHNLATIQYGIGHADKALETTGEAVKIRRKLADTMPDAFLPDLAGSLHNLAWFQGNSGHIKEALTTVQEALAIRRKLTTINTNTFLPDLAQSLRACALLLDKAERPEEALVIAKEAVQVATEVVLSIDPILYLPELAGSLKQLISLLEEKNDAESLQEAVEARKQLEQIERANFPDLSYTVISE